MKRIFTSMDPLLAEQVRSVLENAGIDCQVAHRDLHTLAGAIPFSECCPEVWVVDDAQATAAERLVEELTASRPQPAGLWRCGRCGETLSNRFTSCWRCAGREIRAEPIRIRSRAPRLLFWIAVVLMATAALVLAAAGTVAPPLRVPLW